MLDPNAGGDVMVRMDHDSIYNNFRWYGYPVYRPNDGAAYLVHAQAHGDAAQARGVMVGMDFTNDGSQTAVRVWMEQENV